MLGCAMPLDQALEELGRQDLSDLVDNAVAERKVIDYRRSVRAEGTTPNASFLLTHPRSRTPPADTLSLE